MYLVAIIVSPYDSRLHHKASLWTFMLGLDHELVFSTLVVVFLKKKSDIFFLFLFHH